MARDFDGPWTTGRMVNVKRGERLTTQDEQHRTKGAQTKKKYRTSDRPDGLDSQFGITKRRPSKERARAKRRIRREMQRRETFVAPALKGHSMTHTSGVIATDYNEVLHVGIGHETKRHAEFHAKRGSGIPSGGCK